jgi:hypothetical protein
LALAISAAAWSAVSRWATPMREPLLGQPVHAAFLVAQPTLGQLEGGFARQGFDRGELGFQRRSAFGQCEQRLCRHPGPPAGGPASR